MSVSSSSSSGSSAAGAGLSTVVAPDSLRQTERLDDGVERDLELGEHHPCRRDRVDDDRAVGAGDDDDRVLAVVTDRDQRPAARETVDDADPGVVDPVVLQHVTQQRRRVIGAERSQEGGGGAGPGGGDRLVEALAPSVFGIRVTEDGLAGRGCAGGRGDQIEVGAADDADVEHRRRPCAGVDGADQPAERARTPIGAIRR